MSIAHQAPAKLPSSALPACLQGSRVILHLDLDCFYAQVEHVRLGIPLSTPLAVQQWLGIIAVNYSARAKGIKRFHNINEAKVLCPELVSVHVATYAEGDLEPKYHPNPSARTHKVSLDIYRAASKKIMSIFKRYFPNFQRASVDEAYIDATEEVNRRIMERYMGLRAEGDVEEEPEVNWTDAGHLVGDLVGTSKGWL
jgi:DNA polymerase eta